MEISSFITHPSSLDFTHPSSLNFYNFAALGAFIRRIYNLHIGQHLRSARDRCFARINALDEICHLSVVHGLRAMLGAGEGETRLNYIHFFFLHIRQLQPGREQLSKPLCTIKLRGCLRPVRVRLPPARFDIRDCAVVPLDEDHARIVHIEIFVVCADLRIYRNRLRVAE